MSGYSQNELEKALSVCESEPIHQIGKIQPHGALLVVSAESERILQSSDNLASFFDIHVRSICGESLTDLFGKPVADQLWNLMRTLRDPQFVTRSMDIEIAMHSLYVRTFLSGGDFVLEFIQGDNEFPCEQQANKVLHANRAFFQAADETDITRYLDRVAAITRDMLGFDRVMIYRFDSSWDGEVIAEHRVDSAHSYLGNHFPAADIPPQARRLYTKNMLRYFADVNVVPVGLSPPINPSTLQALDMTYSALRSFSPVHVEYLKNMGVQASLSISLLQNGHLWGLIACHHMTAKRVPNLLQEAASFIGRMVSSKLSLAESEEQRILGAKANQVIGGLLKHLSRDMGVDIARQLLPDLLSLLDASGVIMVVEGEKYTHGKVLSPSEIQDMLDWVSGREAAEVFCCDYLQQDFPAARGYADVAAGVLAAPVSVEMRNCIIWLRAEKIRQVNWAGNPVKTLSATGELRLSPRTSFANWVEIWRGRCPPWSRAEIESAKILSKALIEVLSQKSKLARLESSLISLSEEMQRSVGRELHDNLGQIISAIAYQSRAVKNLLPPQFGNKELLDGVDFINVQATRAADECKRLAYGLLPFFLENNGLRAALLRYAEEISGAHEIECSVACPDDLHIGDPSLELNLFRIVQEAVNNAARHSGGGRVSVTLEKKERTLFVSIRDDGRGFDEAHMVAGMGVKLMRYRANQIGADLFMKPLQPNGTEWILRRDIAG